MLRPVFGLIRSVALHGRAGRAGRGNVASVCVTARSRSLGSVSKHMSKFRHGTRGILGLVDVELISCILTPGSVDENESCPSMPHAASWKWRAHSPPESSRGEQMVGGSSRLRLTLSHVGRMHICCLVRSSAPPLPGMFVFPAQRSCCSCVQPRDRGWRRGTPAGRPPIQRLPLGLLPSPPCSLP